MSLVVKVFGCRPITNGGTRSGAGVRKPAREETADCRGEAVPQAQLWRFKEHPGHIDRGARMQASDWGGEAPPVMWWGHQFENGRVKIERRCAARYGIRTSTGRVEPSGREKA